MKYLLEDTFDIEFDENGKANRRIYSESSKANKSKKEKPKKVVKSKNNSNY